MQTGPFGSQLHKEDYVSRGTPIITVEHLLDNRIEQNNLPRVSESDRLRLAKYSLRAGDIVFSRVGSVDRRALVRDSEDGWLFSGRCLRVRPRRDLIDSAWLSYFFGLPAFKSHIRGIAVGATMPSLNTRLLSGVPIYYPPIDVQVHVAEILTALDNRIDLLRQTNATLESIAQALFKSWFIDFDPVRAKAEGREPEGMDAETAALFPGGFEESMLGMIPEGWMVRVMEDVAARVGMGPFGSNIKVSTFVDSGVPVLTGACLRGTLLGDDEFRFITKEHADRLSGALVSEGDIVITHRGTLGQVSLIPAAATFETYVLSQSQFFVRANPNVTTPEFLTYFLRCPVGQHLLLANVSQVGVPSISRPVSYLKSLRLIVPPVAVANAFTAITTTLHERVMAGRRQIGLLVGLRDSLLPRLVSGRLQFPALSQQLDGRVT